MSASAREQAVEAMQNALQYFDDESMGSTSVFSNLADACDRLAHDPLEQRLKEECDKYGLPLTLNGLLRHIYNNHAATLGAKDSSIEFLEERGVELYDALDELDRYDSIDPDYAGSPAAEKVRTALDGFKHVKERYEQERSADSPQVSGD